MERGPGYFKFNNTLLSDNEFQTKIQESIQETVYQNKNASPNIIWELIKGTIRNESIKFSSFKKKNTNLKEKEIINKIEVLESELKMIKITLIP